MAILVIRKAQLYSSARANTAATLHIPDCGADIHGRFTSRTSRELFDRIRSQNARRPAVQAAGGVYLFLSLTRSIMKMKILTVLSRHAAAAIALTFLLATGFGYYLHQGTSPFSSAHAETINPPPAAKVAVT